LHDVVRNTFIQGSLSIVFATLVAVVFVTGILVSLKALRGTAATNEAPPVLSRRFAPAGLIPTAVERKVQAQWDAQQAR
jgi:carbon starvation protein